MIRRLACVSTRLLLILPLLCLTLTIRSFPLAQEEGDADPAPTLETQISGLRLQAKYGEAAEIAKELLALRAEDPGAHPYELARSDTITLRVNHRQMGLGGDNSWGALPHPEYRLPASRSLHLRLSLGATLLGAAAADGAEAAATVALRAAATAAAVATTGPAAVTGLSPVV